MSKCSYCDEPALTKDHLIPKALGIHLGAVNNAPACRGCNLMKAAMLPKQMVERAAHHRALADNYERLARISDKLIRERGLGSVLDVLS